jgi:hypothetical protein
MASSGHLAEFLQAHVHRRQRRPRRLREHAPVVVADHRDVVRHPAAGFAQRVRHSPRDLIAAAEDRFPVTVGMGLWSQHATTSGDTNLYPLLVLGGLVTIIPMIALFTLLQR